MSVTDLLPARKQRALTELGYLLIVCNKRMNVVAELIMQHTNLECTDYNTEDLLETRLVLERLASQSRGYWSNLLTTSTKKLSASPPVPPTTGRSKNKTQRAKSVSPQESRTLNTQGTPETVQSDIVDIANEENELLSDSEWIEPQPDSKMTQKPSTDSIAVDVGTSELLNAGDIQSTQSEPVLSPVKSSTIHILHDPVSPKNPDTPVSPSKSDAKGKVRIVPYKHKNVDKTYTVDKFKKKITAEELVARK